MRSAILLFCSVLLIGFPTYTQAAEPENDVAQRIELAEKILEVRPVKPQIDGAIDQYLSGVPEINRNDLGRTIRAMISYKALEKIALDAYVEVYTTKELEAMYDYYKKPESLTAANKAGQFGQMIMPEIIRMLDKAMMRVKTGG